MILEGRAEQPHASKDLEISHSELVRHLQELQRQRLVDFYIHNDTIGIHILPDKYRIEPGGVITFIQLERASDLAADIFVFGGSRFVGQLGHEGLADLALSHEFNDSEEVIGGGYLSTDTLQYRGESVTYEGVERAMLQKFCALLKEEGVVSTG